MLVFVFCLCLPLAFVHVDGTAMKRILDANTNLNDNTMRESDIKMSTSNGNILNDPVDPVQFESSLWPGVVPYTISSDFSESEKNTIRSSISLIANSFKCLKFTEYSLTENNIPAIHVQIFKGNGCWSYIGRTTKTPQQLSLGDGCVSHGVIVHEMLHALGFYHEQSRPDRDDYVTINTANIEDGQDHNFAISNNIDSMNVPYDPDSVMHYSRFAFSKNNEPTIVWKKDVNRELGSENVTSYDILQLHLLYQYKLTSLGLCDSADRNAYCEIIKSERPGLCAYSIFKTKLCARSCGDL